eukprot:3336655-Prymnesium_polylepis.2
MACAGLMAYLFISNISEYMEMKTNTDVALDDTGEVSMRIFFNITMVRRHQRARREREPDAERARAARRDEQLARQPGPASWHCACCGATRAA